MENKFILALSVLGLIISSYLTYVDMSADGTFCDINNKFSCSAVSQSKYSTLFGIPVAIYGILMFIFIGVFSQIKWHQKEVLTGLTSISLVFMLYLTITEIFIIKALCIFCLVIAAITILLSALTLRHSIFRE